MSPVRIIFHPDVLAAHAEFGGDLKSMQKLYDWCSPDMLVRLVELTASYCHCSAEYWNDKDANVLIEMARRMAPCTEAAGANLYKLRKSDTPRPHQRVEGGSDEPPTETPLRDVLHHLLNAAFQTIEAMGEDGGEHSSIYSDIKHTLEYWDA